MKQVYEKTNTFHALLLNRFCVLLACALFLAPRQTAAQCTPQGTPSVYGTNNTWIGYVYQGMNFNTYKGYVNEGAAANPNFDESFGGDQVNYNTAGCTVYTDTFSVRYRLTKTFANGNYLFTVGGDDGYRLSLDGGATWVINKWNDQSYATNTYSVTLSGSYNMVLEYYEHFGSNRISFNVAQICTGTGDPTVYGTNNIWNGYIYQGMNFEMYKGQVTEGTAANPAFDENFGTSGNSPVTYTTNSCSIQTAQFSARYRLQKTLSAAKYTFTVGGDDGYRLSLDGGATWAINKWKDQSYVVTSYTANLSGPQNLVLEYYQNGGANRISFTMSSVILPVTLVSWSVTSLSADQSLLKWQATNAVNFDHYVIQRSTDGQSFTDINTTPGLSHNSNLLQNYSYADNYSFNGTLFYRLLMVDLDGSLNYSSVITLSRNSIQTVKIFPTVVENGMVFIEMPQSVPAAKVELFDMSGRQVSERNGPLLSGRQQVSLNANRAGGLIAGSYFLRIADSQSLLAKQIIIIK